MIHIWSEKGSFFFFNPNTFFYAFNNFAIFFYPYGFKYQILFWVSISIVGDFSIVTILTTILEEKPVLSLFVHNFMKYANKCAVPDKDE